MGLSSLEVYTIVRFIGVKKGDTFLCKKDVIHEGYKFYSKDRLYKSKRGHTLPNNYNVNQFFILDLDNSKSFSDYFEKMKIKEFFIMEIIRDIKNWFRPMSYQEEKRKVWEEKYSDYITWEDFEENYSQCDMCKDWTDFYCTCYAR